VAAHALLLPLRGAIIGPAVICFALGFLAGHQHGYGKGRASVRRMRRVRLPAQHTITTAATAPVTTAPVTITAVATQTHATLAELLSGDDR
jgi:hypothetical protein